MAPVSQPVSSSVSSSDSLQASTDHAKERVMRGETALPSKNGAPTLPRCVRVRTDGQHAPCPDSQWRWVSQTPRHQRLRSFRAQPWIDRQTVQPLKCCRCLQNSKTQTPSTTGHNERETNLEFRCFAIDSGLGRSTAAKLGIPKPVTKIGRYCCPRRGHFGACH